MLIISRAIAGLGCSGIFGLVDIIVADITTIRERGKFYAVMTMVWAFSSAVGPLIGGLFVDRVSWRWIFYINLPLGLITLPLVNHFLRLPSPKQESIYSALGGIDWLGSFFIGAAIACFLIGVQGAGTQFDWNSAAFICLMILTIIFGTLFIYVEGWVTKNPVIPLSLFRDRNVVGTCLAAFFIGMTFLPNLYMPEWFQVVLGVDATMSGIRTFPFVFSMLIFQIATSTITDSTGICFPFIPMGAVFFSVGAGLLSILDASSELWKQIVFLFILGIGPGLALNSNLVLVQTGLSGNAIAVAISTLNLIQVLGSTISPAIGAAIFNSEIANHINTNLASANITITVPAGYDPSIIYTDPTVVHNTEIIASGSLAQLALINAYVQTISTEFLIGVAFGGGLLVVSLLMNKKRLPVHTENKEVELNFIEA
ncbi:DNA repair protein rad50 [Physocladia obscura]|uniref:DNA repair protein rad50 n=1 Tax=Physocladia obscura TaxID=109957 RepID=A0AAD5T2E9_9FUNG|nr:DNA repair protein rad50 [Physocladia obscura]